MVHKRFLFLYLILKSKETFIATLEKKCKKYFGLFTTQASVALWYGWQSYKWLESSLQQASKQTLLVILQIAKYSYGLTTEKLNGI